MLPGVMPTTIQQGGSAINILRRLNLTSGLQLCLDAGDAASYDGSSQSWLDRSGNGYDFFLGAGGTATASDPTFNGTAGGLSSAEYFSFDGGDYFTYDTTNETWMQFHKDNAIFSYMGWWYFADSASGRGIFGNFLNPGQGLRFGLTSAELYDVVQRNGSANDVVYTSSFTAPTGAWTFVALYINEAGGAGASFIQQNATVETFDAAYSSPTASNASTTLQIGSYGGAVNPQPNGSRHAISVWRDTLTQGEAMSFYHATRRRFGV